MRAWIVGGAATVVLLAVAGCVGALRPLDASQPSVRTVQIPYRTMSGGICELDIDIRVTGSGSPWASAVAADAVSSMPAPTERPAGVGFDGEVAAFVEELTDRAERSVRFATGDRVEVELDASSLCVGRRVPRVILLDSVDASDDRIPEPSEFPPDLTVVFAGSTGAVCAVTVGVLPDYAAGAGDEEVVVARVWLAAVDLSGIDPVALARRTTGTSAARRPPASPRPSNSNPRPSSASSSTAPSRRRRRPGWRGSRDGRPSSATREAASRPSRARSSRRLRSGCRSGSASAAAGS